VASNVQGKTILITGATNGIGKVAATELAKMGAQVVIVGRQKSKTQGVLDEIKATAPSVSADMLIADLSVMAEVRRLANEFKQKYQRLDVLINNAGAMFAERHESHDGLEMTFALNHMSYFLLTNLLLDTIKASAPSRIINVASDVHAGGRLDFADLQSKNKKSYGTNGLSAYSHSKLMNIMFTYELARRLKGTSVTVNALHPGLVNTGFGLNNRGLAGFIMRVVHLFAVSPSKGADTMVYLASSGEVEGETGLYWSKRKAIQSSSASYVADDQRRLWDVTAELAKLPVTAPAGK
jgi:NAD(P)-dependent dehydrogenase (short-subunit alcohol dehydrogenase family)